MVMVIFTMLSWWYRRGWAEVVRAAQKRIVGVSHIFSLPVLVRTLGAPWRRIITYPGASFDAKLRAFGDNLVSRAIGFTVRMLVLLTAGFVILVTAAFGLASIMLWPLIPPLLVASVVKGILG